MTGSVARFSCICPDTPAAAIEQGALLAQREVTVELGTLPARAASERIGSPAIILIGDVVAQAYSEWSEAPAMERAG